MRISLPRRRLLQASCLLPLSACASRPWPELSLRFASLSPDGQRLQLVLELGRNQHVSSYPRNYVRVLSSQVLALELPARPAQFDTQQLLQQARPLAGPDPEQARGVYSLWQGHALLAQQDLHWCRLEPQGGCTTLGRTPRLSVNAMYGEERWVLGDEGRYLLTPALRVDLTQAQTALPGWAARPGYRAFAEALEVREPLGSLRRIGESGWYELHLVAGRWLLALARQQGLWTGLWAQAYDLDEDRASSWARKPWAAACKGLEVWRAARGQEDWLLWLRSRSGASDHCSSRSGHYGVLDLATDQLWPLPAAASDRLNAALAKVWDPARRRIVLLEAEPHPNFELPQRLRVDELRY